jgi:hypothetical protein
MRPADNIEKLISELRVEPRAVVSKKNIEDALAAQRKATGSAVFQPTVWRIIMKSRITKFAAAAVVIIAAVLSVILLDTTTTKAWALEQSIQAFHSVRSIYVKGFQIRAGMENGESFDLWIKYDSEGKLSHFRMNEAKSADGAKSIVINQGIAKVWMSDKNTLMLFKGAKMTKELEKLAYDFDPKQSLQRLYDLQNDLDESKFTIIEPEKEDEPVIFEVVNDADGSYLRYFFDAETKLLSQYEKYRLAGQDYELEDKYEFFRYNQFIDDSLFELDEIPDDALVIDQATEDVGLEKGDMTDNEVAVEVVRRCLEASIAQDYDKAKKMLGGMPGDVLEKAFGGRILRIISIGKPVPHEKWGHILCVPSKIEVENENGSWIADFTPHVKRLENQPDNRWSVCGGI